MKNFATHACWWEHLDELFAFWMIETYCQHLFPDFRMEQVLEMGIDNIPGNAVLVGLGGGEMDDHTSHGKQAKKSAATLVAEQFGLLGAHPELRPFVNHVSKVDISGSSGLMDASYGILEMRDQATAIGFARFYFPIIVERYRKHNLDATTKAVLAGANCWQIQNAGKLLTLVAVIVPEEINSLAPLAFNCQTRIDILVQRFAGGYCAVRSHYDGGPDLTDVFNTLVEIEAAVRDDNTKTWHADPRKGQIRAITNGGRYHPEVPVTRLSNEIIVELLYRVLGG